MTALNGRVHFVHRVHEVHLDGRYGPDGQDGLSASRLPFCCMLVTFRFMARRASSSPHPFWLFALLLLVGALAGGGYWFFSQINDPFRTLPGLPVASYLENSNGLRGNVYRVDGTVANQLGWTPDAGRLFSVDVQGSEDVLALLVPAKFNSLNVQKGQRFSFEVEVGDKGILRARGLRKA